MPGNFGRPMVLHNSLQRVLETQCNVLVRLLAIFFHCLNVTLRLSFKLITIVMSKSITCLRMHLRIYYWRSIYKVN